MLDTSCFFFPIWLRRSPFSPTSAVADAKDDLEPSVLKLTDPQNIYHFCGQKLDHEDETMLFLELKLYVVYWVEMNEGKRREEHALSSVPKKKQLLDVVFVLDFFGNMRTSNLYEICGSFFFGGGVGGWGMFWVFFIFSAFTLHFLSVSFNSGAFSGDRKASTIWQFGMNLLPLQVFLEFIIWQL